MTMTPEHHQHLAALVYEIGMKKRIEERIEAKYLKRIEYLVGANNELMKELEQCESEIVTVCKESALDLEEYEAANAG
jgi:hypothetical protein